ncbi:MAG: 3-hydroxyisobutyrate dehydrogenase [Alphaproteobacteria bacterium]
MTDIGFVGTGNMGGPMVANLVKAGHAVTAFDVVDAARDAARDAGATLADSASDAAAAGDVVITMLPAGEHVRDVYLGDGGLFAAARPGALLIDSSTIDVETARVVNQAAADAGYEMLDAPVSGGVAGAQAGTLTFMVGGSDTGFSRAEPILDVMAGKIVHAGPAGNGQAAKICNNMILGITMIGISEAFTLADRIGLDAQKLFDISSKASGSCWAMINHLPVPGIVETSAANRDYKPGFSAAMMHKDLTLAQAAARTAGASTPLGAHAAALYTDFIDGGHGGLDYSAIIKLIAGEEI